MKEEVSMLSSNPGMDSLFLFPGRGSSRLSYNCFVDSASKKKAAARAGNSQHEERYERKPFAAVVRQLTAQERNQYKNLLCDQSLSIRTGLLGLIGGTPMADFRNLLGSQLIDQNPNTNFYLKVDKNNPGGSVKDRIAKAMVMDAFENKRIEKGTLLVEATSGNTGIALACVAAAVGCPLTIIMPYFCTKERISILQSLGADVVLAKSVLKARKLAEEMDRNNLAVNLDQYHNKFNPLAHYFTTGPEIWKETGGKITHFVCGVGTGGTITGAGYYLKQQNKDIKVIGVIIADDGDIPGLMNSIDERSKYLPTSYDPSVVDEIIYVTEADAVACTRQLCRQEGVSSSWSCAI
eukprot:GCRY01006193.1.p1 GENE.GCRY01006193.1~~GCRY01006193.1.p1  ORF type:complete len:351 (-),score=35.50 GCRY01006193.1:145-1197(-)